jgi:hypothetical protein
MIDKRTVDQAETLKCKHACETLFCFPKFKFHWGLHSVYILYRRLDTCILKKIMKLKQNSLIMHGKNTLHNGFAKFWSEFLCEIQKSDDDCKLYWTLQWACEPTNYYKFKKSKERAWKYKILYQKQWEAILLSKLDSILFSLMSSGKEFHMETPSYIKLFFKLFERQSLPVNV